MYYIRILDKDLKITISEKIKDEQVRAEIKGNIQNMADLINDKAAIAASDPQTALTPRQIKTIQGMKGIKVNPDGEQGMNNGTFEVSAHYALVSTPEGFAADSIHDSYHVKQWNYTCGNGMEIPFERKASKFTVDVLKKLNFNQRQIETYQSDAILGHLCKKPQTKPKE